MMKFYVLALSTILTFGIFSVQASQTPSEELVNLTKEWAVAYVEKEKQLKTNPGDVTIVWKQAMTALDAVKKQSRKEDIDFSQALFPLFQKMKKKLEEEDRKPQTVEQRPFSPLLEMTLIPKSDLLPVTGGLALLALDEEGERITQFHLSMGLFSIPEEEHRDASDSKPL